MNSNYNNAIKFESVKHNASSITLTVQKVAENQKWQNIEHRKPQPLYSLYKEKNLIIGFAL